MMNEERKLLLWHGKDVVVSIELNMAVVAASIKRPFKVEAGQASHLFPVGT